MTLNLECGLIKYLCNVCVIPSFVETYCLALAEAMIVGCPTVVSYTSALPYTSTSTSGYTLTWSNPTMAFDGIEIWRGTTKLTTLSSSSTSYGQSG